MKAGPDGENGKGGESDAALRRSLPRQALRLFPCCALLPLLLLTGCATNHDHVGQNLMADKSMTHRNDGVIESYVVGCPDVLQIAVVGHPELSGRFAIGADGRIEMERLGRPRVEGCTVSQVAGLLADQAGIPRDQLQVLVADYQSQEVYLFGQVTGLQRAVPYEGPETVLDLLQRTGGITPGAAPADVYVIRSRVPEGRRPEVFHVDLRAIVLHQDERTNVRVRPFDQIHVGETRQARVERSIPPWLRPLYQAVWDTRPPGQGSKSEDQATRSATLEPKREGFSVPQPLASRS